MSSHESAPARRVPRFAVPAVVVAALGVAAFFAVPNLFPGEPTSEPSAPPARETSQPRPAQAPASGTPTGPVSPAVSADRAPAAPDTVEAVDGGDLSLSLRMRHTEAPAGAVLGAKLRIANHGKSPVHLPAEGEPHPTLAVVLVNSEGVEVRRVVETSANPWPRRTHAIPAGAVWTLQATILAPGDEPLPPGRYSVHAEMRADPNWKRLGLPMWTAPKGMIQSEPSWLTITSR